MLNRRLVALSSVAAPLALSAGGFTWAAGDRPLVVSSEHLQSLLVYCLNFGKQMLETSGAFYPFGAVLDPSGKLEAVGGWNGKEHPDPAEIYKLLCDALRARAT